MSKYKKQIFLVTYTLVLFFLLWRFNNAKSIIKDFFVLISPFIYGFVIAYLIKIPTEFYLKKFLKQK